MTFCNSLRDLVSLLYIYIAQENNKVSVYNGSETLSSLVPKIWEFIINSLKEETSPKVFRIKSRYIQLTNVLADSVRNT